jgi:hypothetical protein
MHLQKPPFGHGFSLPSILQSWFDVSQTWWLRKRCVAIRLAGSLLSRSALRPRRAGLITVEEAGSMKVDLGRSANE